MEQGGLQGAHPTPQGEAQPPSTQRPLEQSPDERHEPPNLVKHEPTQNSSSVQIWPAGQPPSIEHGAAAHLPQSSLLPPPLQWPEQQSLSTSQPKPMWPQPHLPEGSQLSLQQGPHVLAIPGTGNPDHIAENVAASALRLSPDELNRIGPPS